VAIPRLKALGYTVQRIYTGDGDSFGPLARVFVVTTPLALARGFSDNARRIRPRWRPTAVPRPVCSPDDGHI